MLKFSPFVRAALAVGLLCVVGLATTAPAQTPPAGDPPASGDASSGVVLTLEARPAIVFSGTADWDDGLRTIMEATDRLREVMGKVGLQPGGRPIAAFIDTDDKGFRYEAMIPLVVAPAPGLTLGEGIQIGTTPVGKAMKFEHRGSYDDIDSTYEAITAYLDEKGLEAQNLFIEEYLSLPKSADDQDMEVDIYVFIK